MHTVYWYSGSNRIQYVIPKHSLLRITPFSIISIESLCANAVIDTFVTSKGFNFLFNHITVWMAVSIESNNARPLPRVNGWAATTCIYESGSNNFWHLTFVLTRRGRQTGLLLICQGEASFFFWLLSIGVRNQCMSITHGFTGIYSSPQSSVLMKYFAFQLYLPSYLQFLWNQPLPCSLTLWCSNKCG